MKVPTFAFALVLSALPAKAEERKLWYFVGDKQYVAVLVPPEAAPPMWKVMKGQGGETVMFSVEDLTSDKSLREQPRRILLANAKGLPLFGFVYGDELCIGDIVIPGGTTTLSEQPQTFDMVNFRKARNSTPCAQTYRGVRAWSGKITMAANHDGDVTLNIYLNTFSDTGQLTYRRTLANFVAQNMSSPRYRAIAQRTKEEKERARRVAMNEPVPEPVTIYGDKTVACYRARKGETFDSDFSRARNISVCVGRPKHVRTESNPDTQTVTRVYACEKQVRMSEYEYCAAAWCVDKGQYYEYCYGWKRAVYAVTNPVRSLEQP